MKSETSEPKLQPWQRTWLDALAVTQKSVLLRAPINRNNGIEAYRAMAELFDAHPAPAGEQGEGEVENEKR